MFKFFVILVIVGAAVEAMNSNYENNDYMWANDNGNTGGSGSATGNYYGSVYPQYTAQDVASAATRMKDQLQYSLDYGKNMTIQFIDCIYQGLKEHAKMSNVNAEVFKKGVYALARTLKNQLSEFSTRLQAAMIMGKHPRNHTRGNGTHQMGNDSMYPDDSNMFNDTNNFWAGH